jgi:two-component system sensor histidine kinase QseC
MVHSLVASGNVAAAATATTVPTLDDASYVRQLSCQIWTLDGHLLARSSGAPPEALAENEEGFATREVRGEPWRVYTIVDAAKGVRVAVGDRIGLRDRLVRDLVAGLIAPAVLIIPLLGLLIWLSLRAGLKPLDAVAGEIAARDGDDMRPVAAQTAPREIQPLIAALNGLFDKVGTARRHERDITAFAAHELRTPLAGLKTQAQIALATTDDAVRDGALRQILVSVDRTSRLVRQLLALAKLEALPKSHATGSVNAGRVVRDAVSLVSARDGIAIEIDPALDRLNLPGEADVLQLILRNLHENAVEHMQGAGRVAWRALPGGNGIRIEDNGPGIPHNELSLVTQRFYRGQTRSLSGTGLGLTIAQMAAERLGISLGLANREDGPGLRCTLIWTKLPGDRQKPLGS